jgi:hypothetical protein
MKPALNYAYADLFEALGDVVFVGDREASGGVFHSQASEFQIQSAFERLQSTQYRERLLYIFRTARLILSLFLLVEFLFQRRHWHPLKDVPLTTGSIPVA